MPRLRPEHVVFRPGPGAEDRSPEGRFVYVLEVGQRTEPARPPARYLLAAVDGARDLPPLQPQFELGAEAHVPTALATDDQHQLSDALLDITRASPCDLELSYAGRPFRVWRVDGAQRRRFDQILEDATVRPMSPLPDGKDLLAIAAVAEPGLRTLPLHRGLTGLATFQVERFLQLASGYARIYELPQPLSQPEGLAAAADELKNRSAGAHAVLLVLPGGTGRVMRFRQGMELSQFRAMPKSPTLRSLDLALTNALVFQTVLGLPEPDQLNHPHLRVVERLDDLVDKVSRGQLQAGFALNPPPWWEIRAVMEAEQTMPPRTFQVAPQIPGGLVVDRP